MRIIMGGSFDPVHIGHLRMATELSNCLGGVSVQLMPCFEAVHKDGLSATPKQRMDMLSLALSKDSLLGLDPREMKRAAPSYTVDSLRQLREEVGEESLVFVMGTDSAQGFKYWKDVSGFAALTNIIVIRRPGFIQGGSDAWEKDFERLGFRYEDELSVLEKASSGIVVECVLSGLEISSSDVRKVVYEGKSARYLVTDEVLSYICDNGIYTNNARRIS